MRTLYIYVSKDVKIPGFSKTKGVRTLNSVGNSGLNDFVATIVSLTFKNRVSYI
jgi:hypothetical protein